MNNFAVITKAEQDVAKAKAHLSVLKQKINDSKAKLEDAKKDYDDNIIYGYAARINRAMFKDFKKIVEECAKKRWVMRVW